MSITFNLQCIKESEIKVVGVRVFDSLIEEANT